MKDKSKEAKALLAMSGYHLTKKAYRKAVSDAEDALEIYQSLGSPRELEAVTAAFSALMEMGDAGGANKIAKDALYRFQDSGNKAGEAETLNMLTNAYVSTGQPELALKTAKEALPIFEELGNKVFEAKLFQLVANLEYQMGRNDKARHRRGCAELAEGGRRGLREGRGCPDAGGGAHGQGR
jgi:tetratricopeptide (TPR) repeat protein